MPLMPPTPPKRTAVLPTDLGVFAELRDVASSSDGRMVAVVTSVPDLDSNTYRNRVITTRTDGVGAAVTLAENAGLPRWSPAQAHQLAVVRSDSAGSAIDIHDLLSGDTVNVLRDWPDAIEELQWSPDGSVLLFVVREPQDRGYWQTPEDRRPPLRLTSLRYREDGIGWLAGRPRQAYLVPVAGGTPRKLSHGGFDDAEFSWHPDGGSVFFVSQRQPDRDRTIRNEVYRQAVDVQTLAVQGVAADAEAVRLTDIGSTDTTLAYSAPRVSPDGALLALTVVDVTGYPAAGHLAVVELATGTLRDLAADADRECLGGSIRWLDTEQIAVLVEDAGATAIQVFDAAGRGGNVGTSVTAVGGLRRVTAFDLVARTDVSTDVAADVSADVTADVTSDGREARPGFVIAVQGPTDPPRVSLVSPDGTESELIAPNAELRSMRELRAPQHHAVPVATGVVVDSWLTLPDEQPGPAGHPLLVWLQGGGTAYGYQWSHEVQALSAAGFAVLYLNPRGSAGYGTAWMRAAAGPHAAVSGTGWGVDDIADVAAVVRATLAAQPALDGDRVGVLGGSYGGLVVTHLLAQTDLFRTGWAERGPYNLLSDAGTKDEAPWFFEAYLGGDHLAIPDDYWAASPLRLVEQITAPLIIVHAEEDRRCAIQQAEELFMALKLLGREVEFVRFPGECHGLTRSGSPIHRLQRLELMLEWFGRWLVPES